MYLERYLSKIDPNPRSGKRVAIRVAISIAIFFTLLWTIGGASLIEDFFRNLGTKKTAFTILIPAAVYLTLLLVFGLLFVKYFRWSIRKLFLLPDSLRRIVTGAIGLLLLFISFIPSTRPMFMTTYYWVNHIFVGGILLTLLGLLLVWYAVSGNINIINAGSWWKRILLGFTFVAVFVLQALISLSQNPL